MEAFDITKDVFLVALDQPLFRFYSDRLHFSITDLFTVIEQNLSIRNGVTSFTLTIFQSQPVDLPRLPMRMRLHSLLGTALTITLFALIKVVKRSGVISLHICEDFSPDKLHLLSSVLFHPYLIHSRKEQEAVTVNVHNTLSNIILTRKPELSKTCKKHTIYDPHSSGLQQLIKYKMKQTLIRNNMTKQSNKSSSISKSPVQKAPSKRENSPAKGGKPPKYKIDAITKDNFEASAAKLNITEIAELPLKYVLRCIEGLYKNRYIFITTHPEGEIFGSGDVKLYGLTLQIQGVGLAPKHAQLKYDGFKSFNVIDFGSETGTWMNIPQEGVEIKDGEHYAIGPYLVSFNFAEPINEIQEICMVYHLTYLSDVLEYNGIRTISQLFAANYNNFQGYPFDKKEIEKLKRICDETKNWYEEGRKYRRLNINYLNEPLKDFSLQIGWETFHISNEPDFLFHGKNIIGQISKGKIVPIEKVFSKIAEGKFVPLSLHSQIKLGNLSFEMTRFNTGVGEDIGFRPLMQDGYLIEEDVGGSEWKLISLFAVFDGHGGPQCMLFLKENLLPKIKQWTSLLDQAGDLNEMVKVLMNKTFFELDYEFYKKYPQLSLTCGCTCIVMLVIQSKVYTFHVGDCKSYLFRNEVLYKMNIDHLPSRGDERNRIQGAGGFVQYDRLMGKCTLSRCFGQFQYKSIEDYENQMKGKLKSYLSCIPDMICYDIKVETDDFMILSSDGIFQSMDIFQVTDFIKERYEKLELQENPNKIISGIIENCKILSPQSDNLAVILIIIRKGELRA